MRKLIASCFFLIGIMTPPAMAQTVSSELFTLYFQPTSTRISTQTAANLPFFQERVRMVSRAFGGRSDIRFVLVTSADPSQLVETRTEIVRSSFERGGLPIDEIRTAKGTTTDEMSFRVTSNPLREAWACPWQITLQFPPSVGGGQVVIAGRPSDLLRLPDGGAFGFLPTVAREISSEILWRGKSTDRFSRVPRARKVAAPGEVLLLLEPPEVPQSRGSSDTVAGSNIGKVAECFLRIERVPR